MLIVRPLVDAMPRDQKRKTFMGPVRFDAVRPRPVALGARVFSFDRGFDALRRPIRKED